MESVFWISLKALGYWIGFTISMGIGLWIFPSLPSGPVAVALTGLILLAICLLGGLYAGAAIGLFLTSTLMPSSQEDADLEAGIGAFFVFFGMAAGAYTLHLLDWI